ncbi:hypothetical protein GCM10018785_72900 [Streptomyces longispororuber]|uniref:Uncharacterized protein n=1 Tax=Streptomyces longispororuber TaxID=68230 RepID=A0A919E0I6_9ACTN|nr:hypothetical protein GCM10018785_72900 [Streptomyces longispororuber]
MFTGIATYYSARAAEDQLKQSRQESEESMRSQASKVTFYGDVEENLMSRRYYLVNRSADPVSKVNLIIEADMEWQGEGAAALRRQRSQLILLLWSVPPCSRIVLYSRNMAVDLEAEGNREIPRSTRIVRDQYFTVGRIFFSDSGGRRWKRTLEELTSWVKPYDYHPPPPKPITAASVVQVKLAKNSKVLLESVKPCGGT